jgi:lipopolysaccharide/colanic/teichoic acid biosynthesis glycosyltransferase
MSDLRLANEQLCFKSNGDRLFERTVRTALALAVAVVVLTFTAPLLLILMLAIRLESPGSPVFLQERVGMHGRRFKLVKLRGMYVDAATRWPTLYDYEMTQADAANLRFHQSADPRVTKVGSFIRRTSLDELPNFVNVLTRDMDLVGPRPEIPELIPYYGAATQSILSVRPGVTSLAKVSGRDDLTLEQTLALDLDYIRRRSLRLDLRIICATARAVMQRRGMVAQ